MQLERIDWYIIAGYFVFILLIGVLYTRRAGKNLDEYFLSGRSLPWWILGTSMVATTFSADTPNLVTDIVRSGGVSGNWVWWAFLITGLMTTFVYAHLWRRSGVLTDLGFYELRYSGFAAKFLRGFRAIYLGVLLNVLIMGSTTLAAMKIANVTLGIDKFTTLAICGVITVLYSCTAGLWGVVITDLLLFIVAMVGSVYAALYALEKVGGLDELLTNGSIAGKLPMLPDFSNWEAALPLFFVPLFVQWWSAWYPGAEPGGGAYVAQRMLAAKDEKHSMLSSLWFCIAMYAIRPWPWIIVALCSLIVYPDIMDIKTQLPNVDESMLVETLADGTQKPLHDIAYPAMLVFLPAGLLGLVIASLAAAYMSTISTHLNWGASYIVDDFYKRFIATNKSQKHYVFVARVITVILMLLAAAMSLYLTNALQAFNLLVQIGAGTGLLYLLRWFWWRINAWSEIMAMLSASSLAVYFTFYHAEHVVQLNAQYPELNMDPLKSWEQLCVGVAVTTVVWVLFTFITPKTKVEVLQNYYNKIRPMGRGWKKIVDTTQAPPPDFSLTPALLAVFFGCAAVYGALFSTGYVIYQKYEPAVALGGIALFSIFAVLRLIPQIRHNDT